MNNNNIYKYKTPKSGNEETSFFNIKGRINRKSFFLRWLFSFGLLVIFTLGYYNSFFVEYESRWWIFFDTIYFYIFPVFIIFFNLIQGAKRMHDVNKSGWYFFIPLYNIYLTFSPGTRGNNEYGIDPSPAKNIQYFDEIESNKQDVKEEVTDSVKKGGLDKWRDHLNNVRKENPNKTNQKILEIARNTYKSNKPANNKTTGTSKKKSKIYLLLLTIVIAAAIYYVDVYEPKNRDSDNDGIADIFDDCPYDYGGVSGVSGCPDNDNDFVKDKNDDCPDIWGNESDGCYYFKKVTFNNDSRNSVWFSIAYKHEDEWICQGWYYISVGASYTFDLPKFFRGKDVFWYAKNEFGAEYTGTDRYFNIATGGNAGFEVRNGRFKEKGGGWAVKKGFYKLDLTDENTNQGLAD
jgi:uncharacterized membrane protein YhaH (DUF805 family)